MMSCNIKIFILSQNVKNCKFQTAALRVLWANMQVRYLGGVSRYFSQNKGNLSLWSILGSSLLVFNCCWLKFLFIS